MHLIYFSSVSNTTHKFVKRLKVPATRLPLHRTDEPLKATEPFVILTPTYGGGTPQGAVPKQVIRFLNGEGNLEMLRGVIASGNTNFGEGYTLAADIISRRCRTPVLYRFELLGTNEDIDEVRQILSELT